MNIVDEYLQFCKRLRYNKGRYVHSGLTKQKLRMFHKWYKQWQRTLKELDEWIAQRYAYVLSQPLWLLTTERKYNERTNK